MWLLFNCSVMWWSCVLSWSKSCCITAAVFWQSWRSTSPGGQQDTGTAASTSPESVLSSLDELYQALCRKSRGPRTPQHDHCACASSYHWVIISLTLQCNGLVIMSYVENSKNHKRWYYIAAHCRNVTVLRSNIIFCDFCCFLRVT